MSSLLTIFNSFIDMGSGATKTDVEALKKRLAASEQRVTELEAQVKCSNVNSKNLDALSQSDLKKLCLELDASNQALKDKLEKFTKCVKNGHY